MLEPQHSYKYGYFTLDSQPPIHWLIDACTETDVSVYGYCCANPDGLTPPEPNRPLGTAVESRGVVSSESAAMRAAAANLWCGTITHLSLVLPAWRRGRVILSMNTRIEPVQCIAMYIVVHCSLCSCEAGGSLPHSQVLCI